MGRILIQNIKGEPGEDGVDGAQGAPGPAGPAGPNTVPTAQAVTAEVNSRTLIYSGGAYPARPSGAVGVTYIGPVQPTTWLPNDEWVDNS